MNLRVLYLTKNNCYISGRKMTVKGIMIHSTGANNPNLKRYVGPDDGLLGVNPNNNHWNQPAPDGREVCVHAFIGRLADGSVATYQTLPWDITGWHSGSGNLGSAQNANNTGYIGFEICEDGLSDAAYFNAVYREASELCAYLCKQYGIPVEKVICHSEGSRLGIASAHADVMHWFPKFGKSMDSFRADVKSLLPGTAKKAELTAITGKSTASAEQMTAYIKSKNANAPQSVINMIPLYLSEGEREGIRGDVAFAQSCLETGNFTFAGSAVTIAQNNFCGLGVTSLGATGNRFDSPQLGIRAQIQHLKAYANTEPLRCACVDARFQYVARGCSPYVEWLGQKENPKGNGWAAGAEYGGKILNILSAVSQTVGEKVLYRVQCGAFSAKVNAEALAAKLKSMGHATMIVSADGFIKVQTGAFEKKQNAENLSATLLSQGVANFITTNAGKPI